MCGIAGLIIKNNLKLDLPEALRGMTHALQHRGPDGEGFYFYKNLGLGHRRLAIIDLSTHGHQPMHYLNDRFVITYNGEVYNYIELRCELESLGYFFSSDTDTEVILAAYAQWGEACVQHFNGMWAFVIFDKKNNSLFCSRDRFGVKPFYYINTPALFVFASEIKALLPFLEHRTANIDTLIPFFLMGVTDHTQQSFFDGVSKLPAGNNLLFCLEKNEMKFATYYRLTSNPNYASVKPEDAIDIYMGLLEDAIQLRLRADVPVGTCLSGGLDSSSIASIAAPLYRVASGKAFYGITAVSEDERNNEARYAQQVIEFSKMNWLQVQPSYTDFTDSLPSVVQAQEEPFSSTSLVMQYHVMKTARGHGIPVLLDGQGADETLLGYERHYVNQLLHVIRQRGLMAFIANVRMARNNNSQMGLVNAAKLLMSCTMSPLRSQHYRFKHQYLLNNFLISYNLAQYMRPVSNLFLSQKFEMENTPLPSLLRYEDKNSMAHSIETRLPFLDYRLVEAALSFPVDCKIKEGWTKWLLRKGMDNRMPEPIAWRKNKLGFEGPDALWLKKHARDMYETVCSSDLLRELTKPGALKKGYRSLNSSSQWRLYSCALWEKSFSLIG